MIKKFTTVSHTVSAVQYDGSNASRDAIRELCGMWVMFTLTIPHVTTGRGSSQVRLMDWVVRHDDPGVIGFSVVPAGVFDQYYKEYHA